MAARPNVLVFFTDQQRWDTCGCYGANPMGLTPALDRMAARGTLVRRSFTAQPVCGPARACLQTGRYATQTGCWKNDVPLPPHERTIAHRFQEAGYWTGYVGKWHLANTKAGPVPPAQRGGYDDLWLGADILEFVSAPYDWRVYDGAGRPVGRPGYRVDAQTDAVLEVLAGRAAESTRPFFLFVSYLEPHHQNDLNRHVAPEGYAARFRDPWVPPDLVGRAGDWPRELPDYYGMVARLDENLGRVLAALADHGLDERTVVLFCSDHGSHFRTRNGEYKRSCHENSIRVPTVFQGPGFDRGAVVEPLVSLVDWPATLLAAAGLPVPPEMAGRSILPLLDGAAAGWPREVFVQISESQVGRAVRTERWKYGVRAPGVDGGAAPGSDVYVEDVLYDLAADPAERDNLVARSELRPVADDLAATLTRRMVDAGETAPTILPAAAPGARPTAP